MGDKMNEFKYEVKNIVKDDDIYKRIINKSYRENPNISLDDLVYIKLNYYNFDNEIVEGEIIVNKLIKDETVNIFKELFENKYQIFSVKLIEYFWLGDGVSSDENSIKHNNSSSFCYREIPRKKKLSYHARGLAIDINPRQNPYIMFVDDKPDYSIFDEEEEFFAKNRQGDHVITHDDICYKIFTKYGFEWGGDWDKPIDYQHFQKDVV